MPPSGRSAISRGMCSTCHAHTAPQAWCMRAAESTNAETAHHINASAHHRPEMLLQACISADVVIAVAGRNQKLLMVCV